MGFFSGIFRIIRGYFNLFGYRANKAADVLSTNPAVAAGKFDRIVQEKRSRINALHDTVATMMAEQEKKKEALKRVTDEIVKYEKLKAGAAASGQKVTAKYNNDAEKTQADPDFVRHQAAFKDFSSTLEEKKTRAHELDSDIAGMQKSINAYSTQMTFQLRDVEKIAQEKNETIADLISSKEQRQVADVMSNLAQDTTSVDLERMRELRVKARASAKVSQNLAGMDTRSAEAEYEAAASSSIANDEFSKMMNFASAKEPETSTPVAVIVPEK